MILNYNERSTIINLKRFYVKSHINIDKNVEVLQQFLFFIFLKLDN
jgi:hypothetical protein